MRLTLSENEGTVPSDFCVNLSVVPNHFDISIQAIFQTGPLTIDQPFSEAPAESDSLFATHVTLCWKMIGSKMKLKEWEGRDQAEFLAAGKARKAISRPTSGFKVTFA